MFSSIREAKPTQFVDKDFKPGWVFCRELLPWFCYDNRNFSHKSLRQINRQDWVVNSRKKRVNIYGI